ncbi:bifunctional cytochrome P450/NADPH--P450 reductase [Paenibacillus dendritiformis]|uniref:bifunctional cytochrome P450/NADPH--P450 reductase n=1 Tax=Paenibacillus dendritiformis TaxID=130049 RepID=UPI00248C20B4|nr:bifunctional cytochrome P450/NADPH--P450 reductase [Paenibacillus dendritiformis]WGU94968.1 bifunctional cytochrome P450/NADPH--P450 reductase [Paenibacillus dendritiformis]
MPESVAVPQPKTFGPLGNLPLLDLEAPLQSLVKLAYEYGPIFRMDMPGRSEIFISGYELVEDACDESRFDKNLWAPLQKVRAFAGDGLFTSATEEPNWSKAHHILLPSFSQRAMQGYHTMMVDIAQQLVQKWARLNPDESVDVPEDMTRLTLDTIGLCGFNYRFNSFYREQPHPFIISMVRALNEAMNQLQRLGLQDKMMILTKRQYKHDIQTMFSLVDKIIAERKAHGEEDGKDLLAHMLTGKDPETGEPLDDENIRYQIITFLIAGHETTSGLLSFAMYYLLKNPEKLQKAYEEVDRVLTEPVPTYTQVRELKYIRMILNEALRLWPTAPAFSLYAKEDTLLAGKYPLKKGDSVNVLIPKLHRDTSVWGDNVDEFCPERFEDPSRIPDHAYKPFGNGQRACIGQQFALQEATLVLGMVLKYFEIIDHTNYQLKVKETLTLKPEGFTIRVRLRAGQGGFTISAVGNEAPVGKPAVQTAAPTVEAHNTPLLVLYGSNLGTAEGIARELADTARYQGFRSEVAPLNERVGKLPKEGVVFIVSASYNGKPPSNAREFVQWLEGADPGAFEGVRYAVFGCGDHNWAGTYQQVPRLIDEQLAAKGATRLVARGEADASGDFEKQLEEWGDRLWQDVLNALGLKSGGQPHRERTTLSIQFVSGLIGTPLAETYDALLANVVENRELQGEGSERSTRHLEIALPDGVTYREGDHLGVLPVNAQELVDRVLRRYGLQGSDHLIISASGRSAAHLPLDRPISVHDLLSHSVELQEAATRAQLREMASFTVCPPHKQELEALLREDTYQDQVLSKRVTMIDLLEKYPACELPFQRFIELLPPLKARYYSISSSPKALPDRVSITVGVVRGPARSGRGEFRGVTSNYLAVRQPGDAIAMFVRTPESGFLLPEQADTPMIMVGPGTGVAPFRGFLQARRALKQEGKTLGEAHLYFGCRNPEYDYLYREELEQYERDGFVRLHTAFSRVANKPKTYVQDLIKRDAGMLLDLLNRGAKLYVCGDGSKMAPEVEETFRTAYREAHGTTEESAQSWLESLQNDGQYVKDVWAGV